MLGKILSLRCKRSKAKKAKTYGRAPIAARTAWMSARQGSVLNDQLAVDDGGGAGKPGGPVDARASDQSSGGSCR
jgi:hypothetical protein